MLFLLLLIGIVILWLLLRQLGRIDHEATKASYQRRVAEHVQENVSVPSKDIEEALPRLPTGAATSENEARREALERVLTEREANATERELVRGRLAVAMESCWELRRWDNPDSDDFGKPYNATAKSLEELRRYLEDENDAASRGMRDPTVIFTEAQGRLTVNRRPETQAETDLREAELNVAAACSSHGRKCEKPITECLAALQKSDPEAYADLERMKAGRRRWQAFFRAHQDMEYGAMVCAWHESLGPGLGAKYALLLAKDGHPGPWTTTVG